MNRKGQMWVSAVLYLLITAVVVVLVLEGGLPLLNKMGDKATFTRTRDNFVNLDQHIQEVSRLEEGTQRVIPIEIKAGELSVEENELKWMMETDAQIIEPRSEVQLGNLRILSCADVSAEDNETHYILENNYIRVVFRKFGSSDSWEDYETRELVEYLEFKATGVSTEGEFNFFLDGDTDMAEGNGYVYLEEEGETLTEATVVAFMNSSNDKGEYELYFTLESSTDFLAVNAWRS